MVEWFNALRIDYPSGITLVLRPGFESCLRIVIKMTVT